MPRVRMLQGVVGPDVAWEPGQEVDMSADDAGVWADGVRGELVRDEPAVTPEARGRRPERAARGPARETA